MFDEATYGTSMLPTVAGMLNFTSALSTYTFSRTLPTPSTSTHPSSWA